MCYRCTILDAVNNKTDTFEDNYNHVGNQEVNSDCNPQEISYSLPSNSLQTGVLQTDDFAESCAIANPGDLCKIRTCSCDAKLAFDLVSFLFDGVTFDPTKRHSNGFEFETECKYGGIYTNKRECCGNYPERYLFTPSLVKKCCKKDVFNINRESCCNGEVQEKGSC